MFIKGMLKEELANSIEVRKGYKNALAKLPRGSLVCKQIKGHPYYYLAFREGDHVRFKYKGKLSDKEIKKYQDAREYRARYRKQISEVNKQIRFLEKVLRGQESV